MKINTILYKLKINLQIIKKKKASWNNHITGCIDNYLHYQICINSYILTNSDNYNYSYIYSYICGDQANS